MKTHITAIALALASLSSFATQSTNPDRVPGQPVASTLTRAQVHADLLAAIARGEQPSSGNYSRNSGKSTTVSTLTRAEVRADLLAASARGERQYFGESALR